jgi:hypothetical protein
MRRAANTMVTLYTATLSSAQYPGTEPGGGGPDLSFSADQASDRLEDRGGPLGRGRRPDGRPYVWQQTLLGTNQVARYAIACPAYVLQGAEDVFALEFPQRRPAAAQRAEVIEPTSLLRGQLGVLNDCLSWLRPQAGLVSGVAPENVTTLRISIAGRPSLTVRAFGHDQPARWAAFVSPPLARGTRVTRVVALDASGRTVAESEPDPTLSHPVCHVFR